MSTLDEIAIVHGTDKASQFSRTWAKPHDYCRHLEKFFEPIRNNLIKLIEIGVGSGESIQTWIEYFPNAKVYGIDLNHSTNEWNMPKLSPHERYTFIHGNQSSPIFWKSFIQQHGGDWDVVIDDGSHVSSDIITTFNALWPHLKSGGIYEIEDLKSASQAAQWLCDKTVPMHANISEIDSIYFAKELCIMRKG